jgi:hypothetical protein
MEIQSIVPVNANHSKSIEFIQKAERLQPRCAEPLTDRLAHA